MKQLKRSRADRVLFGVCGGFAEYFDVDADVVRAISIVLGLTGVGLIPYVVGIFLMPESETGGEEQKPDRLARNIGLGLIAIAGFLAFQFLGIGTFGRALLAFWSWRFFLPALFLAGGILLVWPGMRELVGFGSGRRFRRSVSDRVLAGVCGGLAEELGVDANLVRMGAVLLVFLTSGIAAVAYLFLILVVPEPAAPAAPPASAGTFETPPAPESGAPPSPDSPAPAPGDSASEEPTKPSKSTKSTKPTKAAAPAPPRSAAASEQPSDEKPSDEEPAALDQESEESGR